MYLRMTSQAAGPQQEARGTALNERFRTRAFACVVPVVMLIMVLVLALILVLVLVLVLVLLLILIAIFLGIRIRFIDLVARLVRTGQAVLAAVAVIMTAISVAVSAFSGAGSVSGSMAIAIVVSAAALAALVALAALTALAVTVAAVPVPASAAVTGSHAAAAHRVRPGAQPRSAPAGMHYGLLAEKESLACVIDARALMTLLAEQRRPAAQQGRVQRAVCEMAAVAFVYHGLMFPQEGAAFLRVAAETVVVQTELGELRGPG